MKVLGAILSEIGMVEAACWTGRCEKKKNWSIFIPFNVSHTTCVNSPPPTTLNLIDFVGSTKRCVYYCTRHLQQHEQILISKQLKIKLIWYRSDLNHVFLINFRFFFNMTNLLLVVLIAQWCTPHFNMPSVLGSWCPFLFCYLFYEHYLRTKWLHEPTGAHDFFGSYSAATNFKMLFRFCLNYLPNCTKIVWTQFFFQMNHDNASKHKTNLISHRSMHSSQLPVVRQLFLQLLDTDYFGL